MTIFLLIVSLVQNGILFWFNRKMIEEKIDRELDFQEQERIIDDYASVLEHVRSMELFSGDPTVREFYKKTKETKQLLREFNDIYFGEMNDEEEEKEDPTRSP